MDKLPADVALPSKKEMAAYLTSQEESVKSLNFKALLNKEVQKRRLDTARKTDNHEAAQSAQEEIKRTDTALEGNREYLDEVQKMRSII